MPKLCSLAVLLLLAACASSPSQNVLPNAAGGGMHVLFIGNSLTYTNDLPGMLATIARIGGDTVLTSSVAGPNLALIDHVKGATNALQMIRRGGWKYVVLQQGPTSAGPGPDRDTLVLAAQLIDREVRAAGGRTALLMVWPSKDRLAFFDDVRNAYMLAADTVHGAFYPAGEAWRKAWALDEALMLYGSDDFHPALLGTLVACLEIYEEVTGRDARAVPVGALASRFGISTQTVQLLARAAHDANSQYGRR